MAKTSEKIYHLTTNNAWHSARKTGMYRTPQLAEVGYLHASLAHQILPVANSVFRGRKGLLLLEIDLRKLKSEVRVEDLRRSGSPYPHIYGPINCDAVIATFRFEPQADGTFVLPKVLEKA